MRILPLLLIFELLVKEGKAFKVSRTNVFFFRFICKRWERKSRQILGLKWILWHSCVDRISCFDDFIDRRHADNSCFIEAVSNSRFDWPCERSRSFDWPSYEVKFMEVLSMEPDECTPKRGWHWTKLRRILGKEMVIPE